MYAPHPFSQSELENMLQNHAHQCQTNVDISYTYLKKSIILSLTTTRFDSGENATTINELHPHSLMAPRLSSSILLEQLGRKRWASLTPAWRNALVEFAIAITKLQRARRMLKLLHKPSELFKEFSNPGHTTWDPLQHPEALLLEVEGNLLIRPVQEEIASQMIHPPGGGNSTLQLNMGEGKSSVIVPRVAVHLADGSKLVRVIVPKPQAKELTNTLLLKLGGLLGRRIYHIPFSRSTQLTPGQAAHLHQRLKDCMKNGGILLMQPEHILSMRLMGIEYQLIAEKQSIGKYLLTIQRFFDMFSRDIVDESDECFSPRFELIYTMGSQRPMEYSPNRWIALQKLLSLVSVEVAGVKTRFPDSIEAIFDRDGVFPKTRILHNDAMVVLQREIAGKICHSGFPGLPISRLSPTQRNAVFIYITKEELTDSEISMIEDDESIFSESTEGLLLLLRGVIAGGVLRFVLGQKRWRVNYGLDATRKPTTNLAVPYRAKDQPSTRSEFSHPDVVILLTCLTYYYSGLSDDQLYESLQHLMKSDQADIKYQEWVEDSPGLGIAYGRLVGVNLKDMEQLTQRVFPHLRCSKSVIDYFLTHLVFVKEMREFPHKLSASGWDLGEQKTHPTTGFSGTNDSRHVLPLDMNQLDLEAQRHTNALVLETLLGLENTAKMLPPRKDDDSDTETLLRFITSSNKKIQVILDVGAQILELSNIEVAKQWLRMLPSDFEQEAVVHFDDNDNPCVINKEGHQERLQTSPYAEHLDQCLVFLDEAHTRGTDLKLPDDYTAAATLGPSLTKDKLIQGEILLKLYLTGGDKCTNRQQHA